MSEVIVAKRYADALFQLAEEKNLTDQFMDELKVLDAVFSENDALITVLQSPNVANDKKIEVIDTVFKDLHVFIRNEMKLLIERNRTGVMKALIHEFTELYNEKNDIAHALVYSARKLTDAEKTNVEQKFKDILNKQSLSIENRVDETLLGGLRIRVGNTIYDGSVSGKLKRIEQDLLTASK